MADIKPIPGYEEYYGASKDGRIYSYNYKKTGKIGELAQSILVDRRRKSSTFYRRVKAYHINKNTPTAVHRLVAMAWIPNPDNKPQVNHKDGDKGNNHADNLEWCTCRENNRHAVLNGLDDHPNGEDHHSSKLTEKQVLEIKAHLAESQYHGQGVELAEMYGVTNYTICDIKRGKTWRHL